MRVSYKKLWKILIAKLSNHENVSMDVLIKICATLGVYFGDIMELVPDLQD